MLKEVSEKIAGEIILSKEIGKTIKKWRESFGITQSDMAEELEISSSMISDWEYGRRNPNTNNIRRIVEALIKIDESRGGKNLSKYLKLESSDAIYDINEFSEGISAKEFAEKIQGRVVGFEEGMDRKVYGYTIMDSIKTITSFTQLDYLRLFGWSSQRAMIFCGVKFGRSPMIAIRANPLKPGLAVYHQPARIDELAIKITELERIPLIATDMPLKKLIEALHTINQGMNKIA